MAACDNMRVQVYNAGVTWLNGTAQSITVTTAGASKEGGTLTDANGNSPPKLPISVGSGQTYTFSASTGKGSQGQSLGTLTIACVYGNSSTEAGVMETIVVNYAGHPPTWLHDTHCTPSGSSGMSKNLPLVRPPARRPPGPTAGFDSRSAMAAAAIARADLPGGNASLRRRSA